MEEALFATPVQVDDPELIDTLNQHIARIKQMEAERKELFDTHGHHAHTFYNLWPLYIYVHKMAITIITLFNYKVLSENKYKFYKSKLEKIDFGYKEESPIIDTKQETMDTLMNRLKSAMKMNYIVHKHDPKATKERNERESEWIHKMQEVREDDKRWNEKQ